MCTEHFWLFPKSKVLVSGLAISLNKSNVPKYIDVVRALTCNYGHSFTSLVFLFVFDKVLDQ